ncbi:MAG: HAMP domain-containing histidine kinase, partial [Roseburia sp.]|nr:HAMP domain-containing histidine kinase [Roseburia sp.]
FVFEKEYGKYKLEDNMHAEFGEHQYDAVLEISVTADADTVSVLEFLNALHEKAGNDGIDFSWLEGTLLGIENWANMEFTTRQEVYENTEMVTDSTVATLMGDNLAVDRGSHYITATTSGVEFSCTALDVESATKNLNKEVRMMINEYGELYVYVKPANMKSTSYFVLSYHDDGYVYVTDLPAGETDLFRQYQVVFGTLYSMRYQVFAIFFVCLAVFAASFIFLCCAAGHKKGQNELVQSWFNRVPLEIYATVFVFAEMFCITLADQASWEIAGLDEVLWIIVMITLVLFAGLLLTAAGLEVITRMKLGIFWKNTICYWIISNLFGGMKQAVGFVADHTSLTLKAVMVVGVNAIVDFFIFLIMMEEGALGLLVLAIKTVAVLLLALSAVSQLKKLKEAGEHMAKGNLTYRVDTTGLFWDFKSHGENLNSVSEGLALAVEERMKSERFKTELITNVSHDIKTPLTSIINYVDLMQKEEVDNIKIVEYLEVLERQSKRLKKLLEDLMEASKASAGTLPVGFEMLEAGVFMVQTVGEFEEKTAAQDLELIIKKPEEPIYINADGRHFWRVIDNLMNNICKYAQPNTRVYINLEATEEEVYITFRNTSKYPLNITSEELMERFVRGDESRHTEGSGLGLSIAQSLMELMHGQLDLVVDGDLFKVILIFKRVHD